MNIYFLINNWQKWVKYCYAKGIQPLNTKDPVLLAGRFLDWSGSNLAVAIVRLETYCSGHYVDCPRFLGCDDALKILNKIKGK